MNNSNHQYEWRLFKIGYTTPQSSYLTFHFFKSAFDKTVLKCIVNMDSMAVMLTTVRLGKDVDTNNKYDLGKLKIIQCKKEPKRVCI